MERESARSAGLARATFDASGRYIPNGPGLACDFSSELHISMGQP